MPSDSVKLIFKILSFLIPYLGRVAVRRMAAYAHSWTWRDAPDAKNIVVLGGSFAGIELTRRLADTLPTGYKVVLVEKNSHFNYSFNFPRFCVLEGHEHKAFIPYDGIAKGAPAGIFSLVHDTVVEVTHDQVLLASGSRIDYALLAIATGTSQPLPVQVKSTERNEACEELRGVQQGIRASQKIAIVGGGAVGVELASDIKDFYPEKEVTLIHSRGQLLNHFGKRLQEHTQARLQDELKIRLMLNERPKMPYGGNFVRSASLTFSDGHEEQFDLIIGCTGQRPNSYFLNGIYSSTISKENSRILVRPNLQVFDADDPDKDLPLFAFGDVADHQGPRMARAGWMQAELVLKNILATIHGQTPKHEYIPDLSFEGAIKMTLGRNHRVIWARERDGSEFMIPSRDGHLELGIESAWNEYGVDIKRAKEASTEHRGKGNASIT